MFNRILVCGGRDYNDASTVEKILNEYTDDVKVIIHGDARGADRLAGMWARLHNIVEIPCPASWGVYGRSAGYIRNMYMLKTHKPDLVIAFPGGVGTDMMVSIARKNNVEVREVIDVS